MAKIERTTQKIFASNAPQDDIAALGSFKTGTPIYTDNIATLQNEAFEEGYSASLVANEAPFLEEQNSVLYVLSKQLAYNFQEGIPEYDAATTYYIGSIVKVLENGVPALYYSVVDDNTGNEVTNTEYWAALNLGGQSSGTSLPLFTPVMQDHVLSFDESMGYALQGTYVYKTGVAGERYGYPDFYARCIEEKTAGVETELTVGETTITIYKNTNGHIYYNISDKAAIDSLFETDGIADMYGVDEENERIFLPRNNWFMQLTTDTSKVNDYNEAGLPNITGTFRGEGSNHYSGAIYKAGDIDNESGIKWESTPNSDALVGLNASRSSSVYGKSNTVQPTSSNKLLYYVVGNTEQESAITDVTEVTTTENDTLPLLHHIPADEELNHPAWLRSFGQWNSGNIYTTVYSYLINEYEFGQEHTDSLTSPDGTTYTVTYKTTHGKKVVDVSNINQVEAVYNAIGSAWYYVIDQDNMQFKLPRSHNYECYTSDSTRLGLDVSAGLPNIWGRFGGGRSTYDPEGAFSKGANYAGGYANTENQSIGYNFSASDYNHIYGNSDTVTPAHTEFYLYFKVANAVQNLELLDAGEVLESLGTKTDMVQAALASMPSNRYDNLTLGVSDASYTAPADGWYYLDKVSGGTDKYCSLTNATAGGLKIVMYAPSSGNHCVVYVPAKKGDIVQAGYSATGTLNYFRFIYAEGAK